MGKIADETAKKPPSNRSTKDRRNTLFRVLDGVLSLSHKKIHSEGNSDKAKQGWARVLVSTVTAYTGLLKDEELELRVIELEEKLKNSILIPKPEEKKQMDTRSRRLHVIEKQSVIEEPTEARLLIESDKEMQLHKTAFQILQRHLRDVEDLKTDLESQLRPVLSETDQAVVDASNALILKRFMLLFEEFGKAYVYYGDPSGKWQFWVRLMWLIAETQKYSVQSKAEHSVLDAPDFFSLCMGEQNERLKPVYDKWDRTLFSEESFKQYLDSAIKRMPLPEFSAEEEEEMDRQDREDAEFDAKILREKCPTCPKHCDWFIKEKEREVIE